MNHFVGLSLSKIQIIAAIVLSFFIFSAQTTVAGNTDILLLSCMDYRLVNETEQYMSTSGFKDKYDHIILAGAALGATTDKYPSWNQTFWDHLDVAISLHKIKKVMLLDHRDCGAYKVILGEDFAKDPAHEKAIHSEKLAALALKIKEKYPQLEVEQYLMDLKGKVEKISN